MSAVEGVDPDLRLQVRALGATRSQTVWTILREARIGLTAAIVAAFGGIISEVGAVMLVGGNIEGQTRVLASTQGQLPISLQITAPAGENTFLIVVSDSPLDLKDVLQGDSAPANPQTMQQFGCVLIRARNVVVTEDAPSAPPQSGACNPGGTTGPQGTTANPGGVSGYAARLFSVRGL